MFFTLLKLFLNLNMMMSVLLEVIQETSASQLLSDGMATTLGLMPVLTVLKSMELGAHMTISKNL